MAARCPSCQLGHPPLQQAALLREAVINLGGEAAARGNGAALGPCRGVPAYLVLSPSPCCAMAPSPVQGDKKSRGTSSGCAPAQTSQAFAHAMQLPSRRTSARPRRLERARGQWVWGRAAPPALLWQPKRSLIIAALAMMSNCKENCLANLEGSARGRSWRKKSKYLPASTRAGPWLWCHISLVPHLPGASCRSAKECQRWGGESGSDRLRLSWALSTCRQWDGTPRSSRMQPRKGAEAAGTCLAGPGQAGTW